MATCLPSNYDPPYSATEVSSELQLCSWLSLTHHKALKGDLPPTILKAIFVCSNNIIDNNGRANVQPMRM